MKKHYRPNATEVAKLTVYLVVAYDKEKSKNTSRFRISSKTLRIISGRAVLRDAFVEEWEDALYDLGWSMLRVGDCFALIRTNTIDDWSRIGSDRIRAVIDRARDDDPEVWDEIGGKVEPSEGPQENDEG